MFTSWLGAQCGGRGVSRRESFRRGDPGGHGDPITQGLVGRYHYHNFDFTLGEMWNNSGLEHKNDVIWNRF